MARSLPAPLVIYGGTATQCPFCNAPLRFPRDVSHEELPLETICPACRTIYVIRTTIMPKVDPAVMQSAMAVVIIKDSVSKEAQNAPDPGDTLASIPFREVTENIGKNTAEIFSNIKRLQSEVEAFRLNVIDFFQNQWRYYLRFRDSWNHKHMQEWIDFPFSAFPAQTEDDLSSKYAMFVLSPKFFNPMFGFKVQHALGGMRLELVNQFSRMNFPLETFLTKRFGLPESLDLKVAGNKIVGSSLQLCYTEIHGTKPDSDHSENVASVFISNPAPAKKWLANHGVNPWEALQIANDEIHKSIIVDQISESTLFSDAWNKFRKFGRLGVFWSDSNISRRFGSLCAMSMKGVTVVFVASHKDRMAWEGTYALHNGGYLGNQIAFVENGEVLNWHALVKVKSVILDLHGPVESETIEKLFDYKGRLMVLSPDPVMDYHTNNIECCRVHALCGFETFETPEWENLPVKKVHPGEARTGLEVSLKKMSD